MARTRFLITFLLALAGALFAQDPPPTEPPSLRPIPPSAVSEKNVVYFCNYSAHPFQGWVTRSTDMDIPRAGSADGVRFVRGNATALGRHSVDFWVSLAPYEVKSVLIKGGALEATDAAPAAASPTIPTPTIAGEPLRVRSVIPNGAGVDVHLRTRVGPMLVVDVWTKLFPGASWSNATVLVHANNPTIRDMGAVVPPDFRFDVPGAVVLGGLSMPRDEEDWAEDDDEQEGDAAPAGALIAYAGTSLATWQGRAMKPVQVLWEDAGAESALAAPWVSCIATKRAWPRGTPLWPKSIESPLQWSADNIWSAFAHLDTWNRHPVGIWENARRTGRDWDWGWPGGELGHGKQSLGAELVNRWVAYGYSRRHNPREADGSMLDITGHPNLCLYDDMPFARGGGRDTLGKPRLPSLLERHQWNSWAEHCYFRRLYVAYLQTGDPALQWIIENRAAIFLFARTIDTRFTTTRAGVPREWLWECMEAEALWHCLKDRQLAKLVRDRAIARFDRLAGPKWSGLDVWDVRINRASLTKDTNRADNWMVYQQAAAAYATWSLGVEFGHAGMRAMGLRGSKAVLDRAFSDVDGRLTGWSLVGVEKNDAPEPVLSQLVEGDGASEGPGTTSWMGLAAIPVLHEDPDNAKALRVVKTWLARGGERGQWMAPEAAAIVRYAESR